MLFLIWEYVLYSIFIFLNATGTYSLGQICNPDQMDIALAPIVVVVAGGFYDHFGYFVVVYFYSCHQSFLSIHGYARLKPIFFVGCLFVRLRTLGSAMQNFQPAAG